jgi:hypothetical protein
MHTHSRAAIGVIIGIYVSLGIGALARARSHSANSDSTHKGAAITMNAKGTFDVKADPQADEKIGDPTVGRMSLEKQYHGDLEATSKGQMLTAVTDVKGSAGYVAIERVRGSLHGRSGTFALQHNGTMAGGNYYLNIIVVPDSGTGQLVGLAGKLNIIITDGKHSYDFDYTLPALSAEPK